MINRIKNYITTILGLIIILIGLYLVIFPKDAGVSGGTLITIGAGLFFAKDDMLKKGLSKLKSK